MDVLPSITINNMNMKEVGKACKAESIVLKLAKLTAGILTGVVAVFCTSYFAARMRNVQGMQNHCHKLLPEDQVIYCSNSTLYDIDF